MRNPAQQSLTRRAVLKSFAGTAAGAVALPASIWSPGSHAGQFGSVSQSAVQYRHYPKGTSACANCPNFIPGKDPSATGHCTIVAGDISPKGMCLAYAVKG